MARLRRVLLGHGRERRKALDSGRDAGLAEDEAEAQGRTPEQIAEALGLSDFEHAIGSMIEEAKDRPEIRNGLLAMLLEVSMNMRLYRLDDKDGAHEFLNGWFFKACRLSRADLEKRTALQQHVLTAATTLYVLARDADTRSLLATELHDALERYYQGPVDRGHALRSLIPDPQAGFAAALIGDTQEFDLAAALSDILATRTRRQQLEDALCLAEMGEAVPVSWKVFSTPLGKRLWEALEGPNSQKRVRRSFPGHRGCAFDFYGFHPSRLPSSSASGSAFVFTVRDSR